MDTHIALDPPPRRMHNLVEGKVLIITTYSVSLCIVDRIREERRGFP